MPVRLGSLGDAQISDFDAYFSATSFDRGARYAREGRVQSPHWDADECTLSASVVGHGAIYSTTAYFEDDGDEIAFVEGECTCPIGINCKHVVAAVLAASGRSGKTPQAGPAAELTAYRQALQGSTPQTSTSPSHPAPWERPLRALLAARTPPATGNPLAIEFRLTASRYPDHGAPRLMARLMRPGARGGWVNGSLDWGGLDSWTIRGGGFRDDHVALLNDLLRAYRLRGPYSSYMYGYRNERSIDLSTFESPQLWPLLDKAARLGLPLIHADASLGELPRPESGQLVLDVTRAGPDSFGIEVILRIDGGPVVHLVPVRFIGSPAHGIVCAERADVDSGLDADRWRIRLVRLERPAVAQLERMLLDGERIAIPAPDLDRFASELCPGLRHIAPVVSSDGSFSPPTVSPPSLVLRAEHGPETLVTVGWEWEYAVGDSVHRTPLDDESDLSGVRDHAAERAQRAELVLDEPALQSLSLLDLTGRPASRPPTILSGLESLRFVTEVLPRLNEQPGIRFRVLGDPPDYRDVGDSLEVGVSTGEIAGERDWFDLGVTISVEGRELPFVEVFTALARDEARMLLDDGAYFSLADPRLESLRRLIEEARALTDSPASSLRISRYQADLWAELAALGVVTEQAERWQRIVAPLLELDTLPEHETPASLGGHLRPYQREGFSWLATLWDLELGGILADDMGLGKTVQTLALVCHARRRDQAVGPFLVIAPTSVAPNWAAEATRFAPELNVEVVLDTLGRSGRAIEEVAAADIVVTTYTLFRLDSDAYGSIPWAALVLDEAQYVKNHRGKTYRCARELRAPFKLAITGTPMENNLMELWALLSITAPGLFPDPVRFAEHYARPIERRSDSERMTRLRRRIKPLLKRRTKELVAAELPPKQEQTLEVELHPRHRRLYDTHLQRERQKVLRLLDDFDRNRFTILQSIMRMRQLSLHPALVDARHSGLPCAKLDALVEQLDDVISSGHRALVFSQFTGFLSHVRGRFDKQGIGHCYLDGRTRRRDEVLRGFRDGTDPVFLISLKAGGVGLNLTEADYCFLLDPWWNPAVETQAIDRAHRIGQTRPVMVYRLIARDTIEQKVRALAERKADLFRGLIDDGELFARGVTAEDIRGLLA
jgi:superfamily II DNA or RNA helicase